MGKTAGKVGATPGRAIKERRSPAKRGSAPPAKISVPLLSETYRRERLFRTLDDALRKHVLWVAGPAGAGKTSVITTYLEARKLPTLWYNVDARDSDVANLFHYLPIAARLVAKRSKPLPVFSTEHQTGVGAFARGFFEALGAGLGVPAAIVIDDYHEVRSELFDEVLREAIGALPRGVATIIIGRTEAPRWLARHLASGDVASLEWGALRLTPQEVAGLVRVYRPDLRGRHLTAVLPQLIEVANGWVAALMLLLQSRHPAPIDACGMEEFSQRLFDYFATEILDKVTPTQRSFLLKTSVVPSFTSTLAVRLTGIANASNLLAELERQSFLIQRLGTSGARRYHPLLRGFLLREAEAAFGRENVRNLHRTAAGPLLEAGQIDEAMEQLELAEDFDAYTDLVLRMAPSYMAGGRGRTIEAWIGKLPRERVEQNGWLLQWEGVSCLAYSASRSRQVLERAYAHFIRARDSAGLYSCCAAGMQAIIYEGIDHSRCDAWVKRLEGLLGEGLSCPEPLLPMVSTAMLMVSIFRRPEAPDSDEWAERALALARTSEDVAHRVITGGLLAQRFVLHESLDGAEIILEMLRASARASESSELSLLTLLQARAMTAWASGENAVCIELVREALAAAARSGIFVWNDYLVALGMEAALGSEDFETARDFLAMAGSASEQGRNFAVGAYYFYGSLDAFLRGEQTRALHLIALARESGDRFGFPLSRAIAEFAYAQILWQVGNKDEARAALGRARQRAAQAGYSLVLQGCDLVESDLEWNEDREHALACLRRGLKLARERGYHNAFWLRRSTLTNVAVHALEYGIEQEHVRASIAKHRLVPPSLPLGIEGWPFPYRLCALGKFGLSHDGQVETRSVLRGMPLRLLHAILAFGARGVRDTDLVDALWPDAEGDAGRRVFDTTLYRLRRQIGNDDIVRLTNGRISLDERLCWVDTWALEHCLAEADRQVAQRASASALVNVTHHLLALYRGPLLADEPSSWALGPRHEIAAKFRRTAERLGAVLESLGQLDDAKALYQRSFRALQ